MSTETPGSLPKRARLRRRGEFLRVQRDGRRIHTEHFVLLAAPASTGVTRVGVTVSTRVGNAVVRNRIKRVLREVLRRRWRGISPAVDVVVIAKPGAEASTYASATAQIGRALGARAV